MDTVARLREGASPTAGQNNAAAERSAHVTRGPATTTTESTIIELPNGASQLRVVAALEREVARLRGALKRASDTLLDAGCLDAWAETRAILAISKGYGMTNVWYNLEGDTPVPVPPEKVNWDNRWHLWTTVGRAVVSTVFVPLDQSVDGGEPLLFETMVFGGPLNDEGERHHTKAEAVDGHMRWINRVQEAKDE